MVKLKLSVGGVCNDNDDDNNDYNVLNLSHTEQQREIYIKLHSDKGIENGFDLLRVEFIFF